MGDRLGFFRDKIDEVLHSDYTPEIRYLIPEISKPWKHIVLVRAVRDGQTQQLFMVL